MYHGESSNEIGDSAEDLGREMPLDVSGEWVGRRYGTRVIYRNVYMYIVLGIVGIPRYV